MIRYLVFNDLASAKTRSAVAADGKGCDDTTDYWWSIVKHPTNGKAALLINGTLYDTSGLTSDEIAALVDAATLKNDGWFPDVPLGG